LTRRTVVEVADFAGVRPFIVDSQCIATLPALLRIGALAGLAHAAPPFDCEPMPMYALWHRRHHDDPMHRWLLAVLDSIVEESLAAAG
jgi:DNA-binding transcriptional LysR family regulator